MAPAIATLNQPAQPRYRDRPFVISPNLTRAKVSRERPTVPKPPPPRAEPKPAPVEAPAAVQPKIEITGRVIAVISNYDELWAAIRARTDELQITRETLCNMADLEDGYVGKLLGGAQVKKFGRLSLGRTLGALGCDLALIEDEIQTAKIRVIDKIFSGAAAALGISRAELARLAGFTAAPPKTRMSEIDAALASAGCRLALVEDSDAAKIMARCEQRKRPLRPAPMVPT